MFGFGPFSSAPIGSLPVELMPDVIALVKESSTPLEDVRDILTALKEVSETMDYRSLESNPKYSKLRNWIPDTPEKLGAYAGVIALVIELISIGHPEHIEVNNTFITQYQVIINSKTYFDYLDRNK